MHDATWRGKFGGQIYKTSGSHGCINLPLSFIKDFYRKELRANFSEEIPEDAVDDCADDAYEIYCRGDGHTEYEALEQAVAEFLQEREEEGGQ